MSCHTFMTIVNPDPDTVKIVKTLLQDLCMTLESYLCYPQHGGRNNSLRFMCK